jgi:hypothetical protein
MLLIALAGKARVGKDTIGQHLVREYGFHHYYFAKPLKAMLTALGFPERDYQTTEQKEAVIPDLGRSYRYLAQTLGTEWGRYKVHNELWQKMAAREWEQLQAKYRGVSWQHGFPVRGMVVTDCRFGNEAAWVRDAGGVVVHIHGNDVAGMSAEAKAHESETTLPILQGDRQIWNQYETPSNETLRALRASVDALINGLLTDRGFA